MARAKLRPPRKDNVRIGPITLFTLVVVLCLAVLAVLAASTANAAHTMADRRATATTELYLDERAAQEFLAGMDEQLAIVRASGANGTSGAQLVGTTLGAICDSAQAAAGDAVEVSASASGQTVHAEFACENGRVLNISVTILDDATYRIDRWRMTAVQNEEPAMGGLWTGA